MADAFQIYRDALDRRVAEDLGAWAVDLAGLAALKTDRELAEKWASGSPEADIAALRGLGARRTGVTPDDRRAAGFSLAIWERLEGLGVCDWLPDYDRVFGDVLAWDVKAEAVSRRPQLSASDKASVLTMADDRTTLSRGGVDYGRLPAEFTSFDPELAAMRSAAKRIAASREFESRAAGITVGPVDDEVTREDWEEAQRLGGNLPYEDFAALPPPVRDFPDKVVDRWFVEAGQLRDRARPLTHNITAFVESCAPRDQASLNTVREKLRDVMPAAYLSAISGMLPLDAGIRESLRLENARRVAAARRIQLISTAAEGRCSRQHALEEGEYSRRVVERIDMRLTKQREEGLDAASWFSSDAADQATRGCALSVVEREWERECRLEQAVPGVALTGVDQPMPPSQETYIGFDF